MGAARLIARSRLRRHVVATVVLILLTGLGAGVVMASNGFGVQVVPESARAIRMPGLVYRPLGSSAPAYSAMDLQCAYLRNEASPLLQGLLDVVRDYRNNRMARTSRGARATSAPRRPSRRANAIR